MNRRSIIQATLAMPALSVTARAQPQGWPNRPVRIIVPFPPGGGTDGAARLMAMKLGELLHQTFVIDNRGGAGGMIGTKAAGQSQPDGYTLLFNGTASVIKEGFDPRKEVKDIVRAVGTHNLLVVNKTIPVNSPAEFIAYAKARPHQLNHGTAGPLTAQHLAEVMFALYAGLDIENVHYRGTGPAITGLLGNEVQFMFGSMSAVEGLIRDGQVKALATASSRRTALFPELPVLADAVPGYAAELTYTFSLPHGTPQPIADRLSGAVAEALKDETLLGRLAAQGFEPAYLAGPALTRLVDDSIVQWADVLKRANVTLE